jgi:hypothetical protein
MPQWRVVKTGSKMFDTLHAYGLGVLIANATVAPVELCDTGMSYLLESAEPFVQFSSNNLLDEVLKLPEKEDISNDQDDLLLGNMDGLLAALFTVPGPRIVSVSDATSNHRDAQRSVSRGLRKVNKAKTRWIKHANVGEETPSDWFSQLLAEYDAEQPVFPVPAKQSSKDISVLMTLEPEFSLASRNALSDALFTDKFNIAFRKPQYATLMAFIGAARFLRAQRVLGRLVNFYIPVAERIIIVADISMPRLRSVAIPADHALAMQWLNIWRYDPVAWQALAYQTMQTNGPQQSTSRWRGVLGYRWLRSLADKVDSSDLIDFWERTLAVPRKNVHFETDKLADSLLYPSAENWFGHLKEQASCIVHENIRASHLYYLSEVQEILKLMNHQDSRSLGSILEQSEGTQRFGHALRLLRKYKPHTVREIIDELEIVADQGQLIRVLAQVAQECAVAKTEYEIIIVPCDDDLQYLLDDTSHFGAKDIAGLLIILSALRYPKRSGNGNELVATQESVRGVGVDEH